VSRGAVRKTPVGPSKKGRKSLKRERRTWEQWGRPNEQQNNILILGEKIYLHKTREREARLQELESNQDISFFRVKTGRENGWDEAVEGTQREKWTCRKGCASGLSRLAKSPSSGSE